MKRLGKAHIARGLLALALAAGCGAATNSSPIVGGETHFLRSCSARCGDGLACIAGICTRSCLVAQPSCDDLASGAVCTDASVEPGAVAVCDLGCTDAPDCSALGRDYSCQAGFCRAPELGNTPPASTECPVFGAGVATPTAVIEAAVTPIPGAANVALAVADAAGLYWIDRAGVVYGLRRGAAAPEQLSAPALAPVALTGFVGDGNALYWGEAVQPEGPVEPGPPLPPGKLLAAPKAGNFGVTLAESDTRVFAPLGVRGGQVIAEVQTGDVGIFGVPTPGGGDPVRLRDTPSSGGFRLRGDDLYYVEGGEVPTLFRARLDGSPAQPVTRIEGSEFALGPDTILWKKSETTFDPLTLVESLVLFDEATGCVIDLPGLGETISIAGLDADHVYWKSYNGLGSFSPGDVPEPLPLIRVDLHTGYMERLSTPGFDATVTTDYLTEDESAIYFRVDGGLVAVQKP